MTLTPELLADSRGLLFVQEQSDRARGELSADDSWLTNHLQITMISVMATDRTTLVKLLVERVVSEPNRLVEWSQIVEGEARRDSKDKSDPTTGILLATSRALQKATNIIDREATGRVKHADDMRVQKKHQKAKRRLKSLIAVAEHDQKILATKPRDPEPKIDPLRTGLFRRTVSR